MDILLFRQANLQVLMEEMGLSKTEFAKRLDFSRPYISRLFSEYDLLGDKTVRGIEKKLRLPLGYLDGNHDRRLPRAFWDRPQDLAEMGQALVPRQDFNRFGMGKDGDLIHDHPPFLFTKNFLIRKKVTFRMNLFFLTAIDSSMSPRIDEYGVVMFDIGQKEIISQEIYVVRMNGDQRLRRIVKMLGGDINVRCDNPVYGDQIIPKDKEESLEIVGRVLWVADPMEW